MNCRICKRGIPDNSLYCNWCGTYQLNQKTKAVSVPTPKQLPSGKWRIWLDKEKKSVTADTPAECTALAVEYRRNWQEDETAGLHAPPPQVLTLYSVIESYITSREPIRSPATIEGYRDILRNRFKGYMQQDVSTIDFQRMVNDEVSLASAKTIANAWGLVRPALTYAGISFTQPELPRIVRHERNWLDYNQITLFLSAIEGSPYELPALLALHSLRKSELLALTWADYDREKKLIHVRGALLRTESGYVYSKLNKTDFSARTIPVIIPRLEVLLNNIYISKLSSLSQASSQICSEPIVAVPRDGIYKAVNQACLCVNLPTVGIHGLRHSFASLAYHLGWKKMSTMAVGGWRNSKVLDAIYTHNADLQTDVQTMTDFFVQNPVQKSENKE